MLEVGWSEILVIAIILIVVVGPKDLPPMIRAFGQFTKRLRKMAGEFQGQFDQALKDAELDDVRKTIGDAAKLNPVNSLRDAMNPLRQMGSDLKADLQKAVAVEKPATTSTLGGANPGVAPEPIKVAEPVVMPDPGVPTELTAPVMPPPAVAASAPVEPVVVAPEVAKEPKKARAPAKPKAKAEPVVSEAVAEAKPKAARKAKAVVADDAVAAPKPAKSRKKTIPSETGEA